MKITIYHNVARECRYCGVPARGLPSRCGTRAGWTRSRRGWPTSPVPPKKARCVPTSLTYHVGASAGFDGYKPGQPMARVFVYESNAEGPDILAEQAFMLFNADPEMLPPGAVTVAAAYRARRLRSLSFPGKNPCCPRPRCVHRGPVLCGSPGLG